MTGPNRPSRVFRSRHSAKGWARIATALLLVLSLAGAFYILTANVTA